jgi:hypothetical protein
MTTINNPEPEPSIIVLNMTVDRLYTALTDARRRLEMLEQLGDALKRRSGATLPLIKHHAAASSKLRDQVAQLEALFAQSVQSHPNLPNDPSVAAADIGRAAAEAAVIVDLAVLVLPQTTTAPSQCSTLASGEESNSNSNSNSCEPVTPPESSSDPSPPGPRRSLRKRKPIPIMSDSDSE